MSFELLSIYYDNYVDKIKPSTSTLAGLNMKVACLAYVIVPNIIKY